MVTPRGRERSATIRAALARVFACAAAGIVAGAAYVLVAQPLAPFVPLALNGAWFVAIVGACTVLLGIGLDHRHPRLVIASSFIVAALAAVVYGAVLSLPGFLPGALNIVGLVNYALTQAAVTFFIVLCIAFPGAIVGLLMSYWWYYR